MTCQKLPGSLGHEDVDMRSFADWGVDYIKMDSCYAEKNGRTSEEDYDDLPCRDRPDRSSDDPQHCGLRQRRMDLGRWPQCSTVADLLRHRAEHGLGLRCAETSAGSTRIHPAFNGLWQFAGPGRWNDPDMLQVGNMMLPDAEQRGRGPRALQPVVHPGRPADGWQRPARNE